MFSKQGLPPFFFVFSEFAQTSQSYPILVCTGHLNKSPASTGEKKREKVLLCDVCCICMALLYIYIYIFVLHFGLVKVNIAFTKSTALFAFKK